MNKFFIYCGTQLVEEARFCSNCGKAQSEADESATATSAEEYFASYDGGEETVKKKRSRTLIFRNSLILAIAVILFALSFAPFIKAEQNIKYPINDYGVNMEFDAEFDLNSIDMITFFFDSFKSLDESELEESELFDKVNTLQSDLTNEIFVNPVTGKIKLTDEGNDIMKDFIKLSFRLVFQSDGYTTGPTAVLPFIASLAYMLLALALLVFAFINFLCGFGHLERFEDKAYSYSLKLLAGIPGLLLARYLSFFLYLGLRNTYMAWGTILSLILSGGAIITIISFALIHKWHDRRINIPLRVVASVLSVIAICMTFAPIMTASINTKFSGSYTESEVHIPIYSTLLAGFDLTEEDWTELEEVRGKVDVQKKRYFNNLLKSFQNYTKAQINSGIADADNMKYLGFMVAVNESDSFITMFSMVSFVYYAFAVFLSMVLQQNLRCLMDGNYSKIQSRIGRIAGIVSACAILAATIVLLSLIADSLFIYAPKSYRIDLGAGGILLVLFAIAACVLPDEKHKIKLDEGNGDAPISEETVTE